MFPVIQQFYKADNAQFIFSYQHEHMTMPKKREIDVCKYCKMCKYTHKTLNDKFSIH